jgi:hypothetical protein
MDDSLGLGRDGEEARVVRLDRWEEPLACDTNTHTPVIMD